MKINTKRLAGLLLTLVMIVAMFTMMSVSASAEDAPGATIIGTYVNVGGDIEMNYAVLLDDGVDIQDVKLRTVFLGEERYLTATESDFSDGFYTFTLEGINPQCLGDKIDAELYVGDRKVDEMPDFSVEDNLLQLKATDPSLSDENKALIDSLLAYGKASEAYTGHSSLVGDYEVVIKEIPAYRPNFEDSSSKVSIQSANVRFGTTTYLMFTFIFDDDTPTFDLAGAVTIDNIIATTYMVGDTCVAISAPISPENFHKDVEVNYNDELILMFSVNDYCDIVTDEGSDATENMKTLAQALYNYGLSAHIVKGEHLGGNGTDTCEHGKVCDVCGNYYGTPLAHDYSYEIDDAADTITMNCQNGCGQSKTVKLTAPENAVYSGEKHEVTVTGANGVEYSLTYSADPINAGSYTATLTIDDVSVSVNFSIAKATPTYTIPTGLTATYGQTLANVTLPEGWSWKDATTSVGNAGTNTFTAIFIPTDTVNYVTIEAEVTLEVAKAEINIDDLVDPEFAANLVYNGTAQELVTANGSVPGGTILYSLTYDGEYTSTIPVATEAGRYGVYWLIQGDENHEDILSPGWTRVIIAKAASSITTAPSGKELTYKGYAQALVTAGEAMGGTILYSLDNATWNEEIPVGKEIGDYTVYYKVIGDNNHDDIATQSVTVAIKACEHSYNEDGFCEMCSTANPDETMFFIFDGDHKAFNVAEDLVGVNIEYTRGLHNTEWNSLYLPFEVPVTEELLDEFEFAYVNDMHSADTDDNGEIDKIEMEIVKIKEGTLHANHPYFIRAKSEYTILQLSYENTTLHATKETTLNCSSIYMDYAIVGTYKQIKGTEFASMPADRYYAISIDGGWWQIPEDSSLYPFRAYLSMTARDGSPVKVSDEAMRSIRIREKGEGTTGIEEVKGENGEVKTIYDLQGRKVEVPSKGLYIINGKKVFIK